MTVIIVAFIFELDVIKTECIVYETGYNLKKSVSSGTDRNAFSSTRKSLKDFSRETEGFWGLRKP
jgi:hypothetical protein